MESSIVATALVTIGEEFQNFGTSIWTVLAYLLTYMGLAIVFARLSDVTGRRMAVLVAWTIFTVFSLAAGFSSTLLQLIVFRALQGIGGSGLYTLTMVVVPEITPYEFLPFIVAALGATLALAAVLGPILGGVISLRTTWRWVFWLNAPCGMLAIIIILLSWPHHARKTTKPVKLAHVDWLGAILLIAGSLLLVYGLQEAGSAVFAWNSSTLVAVIVVAGLCWIAFVAWIVWLHKRNLAGKTHIEGIFPPPVISKGNMAVVVFTTFCTGFIFLVVLIYLPERYQVIQLKDPIGAGVAILPLLCSTALGSMLGAFPSIKKNNTFWSLNIGNALLLIGCGLLSTADASLTIPAREYGFQILIGTGIGMSFTTATLMCALTVRFKDYAVAQGVVNQARVLGGAIAVAIATLIFNQIALQQLSGILTSSELSELQKNPLSAYEFTLDKQIAVRNVFAVAFTQQLRICTYVMAVSWVVSLLAYSRNPPNVLTRKANHEAYLDGLPYNEDG